MTSASVPVRSSSRLTFLLIPHTHWDREWYLPRAAFLARLVPMLDDLIDRLERQPAFRSFLLDGQTVLVDDYLGVRPEQTERVRALVRAGRLQLGPWYVLADELVPSGESLVRNLLLGQLDAAHLGGRSDVLYSPDAFGHPAAWPALAAEFGIGYGVLWRGLGGEAGQDGDLYRWRAPDGRSVLLYHLPPDGYEVGAALPADTVSLAQAWPRLRAALTARAVTSQVAVFVGADHHAAHPQVGGLREGLSGLEREADVRVSRLDDFLIAAAEEAGPLPELTGELRWSYGYTWTLQGVQGTRASLKRRHAEAELWLERVAEPLAALAAGAGLGDRGPLLRHAWRTLVRSQFHDSIGGCTSDEVARRVLIRMEDAESLAREIAGSALGALAGDNPDQARDHPEQTAPRLVIWNPVPREREGVVIAELTSFRCDVLIGPPGDRSPRTGSAAVPLRLMGPAGPLQMQELGRYAAQERLDSARHYPDQDEVEVTRVALIAPRLSGFGLAELAPAGPEALEPARPGVGATERGLDNGLIEIAVGPDGSVGLHDRATGQRFTGLFALESGGDVGDTYSYAAPAGDRIRSLQRPPEVRVLASGPLVGALEVRGVLKLATGRVGVRLVLSVHTESPALRCTLELDNQALDHRVRVRCPSGVPGQSAVAGAAFGHVERRPVQPNQRRYPRETPVATAPAQRFVATAIGGRGLALFAPGFFEYEHTARGDLVITLFRAIGQLSRDDLPTRQGHAGWPTPTPEAQEQGCHRVQLALQAVGAGDLENGATLARLWEDVFLPPRAVWLRQAIPLRPSTGALELEGAGLVFSALKPADSGGGIVLRCYNGSDLPSEGGWRLPWAAVRAQRVRADEQGDPMELTLDADRRGVRFTAAPRAIVTIVVSLSPS
ncbi:MAG TPA: glycoside hydrolase family 38 C-terminal domain-containing protein [Gemmatimonadales bacterium]|nr:glycoside hydrolase family 38 C-terminal domain-containing protein [Gemmatimonadales bacterium]